MTMNGKSQSKHWTKFDFFFCILKVPVIIKLQPIIKLSYQGYKGQTSIGLFEQSQPARYGYCCEYRD